MLVRFIIFISFIAIFPFSESQSANQFFSLEDGNSVTTEKGLWFGAPLGTLEAPLNLQLQQLSTTSVALPSGITAFGDFYKIATIGEAIYNNDIIVGLPVNSNVNLDEVAIGILVPPQLVGEEAFTWDFDGGLYDKEKGLLSFTLPALLPDGLTLSLVKGPFFGYNDLLTKDFINAQDFRILCESGSQCTSEDFTLATQSLVQTDFDLIKRIGFRPPELRADIFYQEQPNGVLLSHAKRYKAWLYDSCEDGLLGQYFFERLRACTKDLNLMPDVLRHEYFHAIQQSYENSACLLSNCSARYWVIEGMAEASVNSNEHIMRGTNLALTFDLTYASLIDEDNPLEFPSFDNYSAQDFWIFLGRRYFSKEGLSFFKDFLEAGPDTLTIDTLLQQKLGTSLGEAYWEFAKNQAYEKRIKLRPFESQETTRACSLNPQAALPSLRLQIKGASKISESFNLNPLESKLVRIDLAPTDAFSSYLVHTNVDTLNGDINYKIYRDGELSCMTVFESSAREFEVGQENIRLYVLISNINVENSASIRVQLNSEAP